MPTSGADSTGGSPAVARRPSRYESQKRRDWQTFTRYLSAHRPPLQLRRCSGAHVLEFLRHLDRSGKTRVHAPQCPAYGGANSGGSRAACQCPLRQAWGSLDALVGRLRAAYDERHGCRGGRAGDGGGGSANPFAARAVRLYLRDVRDTQSRARGISYHRKKKKKRSKQSSIRQSRVVVAAGASASSPKGGGAGGVDDAVQQCARAHGNDDATTLLATAAAPEPRHPHPPPPPQAYLHGVPSIECCDHGGGGVTGGVDSATGPPGFYLPLLFNTFG